MYWEYAPEHWRGSQGFMQAREVLYLNDLFQQLKSHTGKRTRWGFRGARRSGVLMDEGGTTPHLSTEGALEHL